MSCIPVNIRSPGAAGKRTVFLYLLLLSAISPLFLTPKAVADIELLTKVDVHYRPDKIIVELSVANNGSEAALEVTSQAVLKGIAEVPFDFPTIDLPPGETADLKAVREGGDDGFNLSGSYPVLITINYRDSGGQVHGIPACGLLKTGASPSPKPALEIKAPTVQLPYSALAGIEIYNHGSTAVAALLSFHIPPGLEANPAEKTVTLGPGEKSDVFIKLINKSINYYSTMPWFVIAGNKSGEREWCSIATGRLIFPNRNEDKVRVFRRLAPSNVFFTAVGILIGVAAVISGLILRKNKSK